MKAYRGDDGRLRLFRPDRNMIRMLNTAKRVSLPEFDMEEMIKCIKRLIQIDRDWIPHSNHQTDVYCHRCRLLIRLLQEIKLT